MIKHNDGMRQFAGCVASGSQYALVMRALLIATILIGLRAGDALGCSCLEPTDAKGLMEGMGAVFRGKVMQREVLAPYPETSHRKRYRLTMQVFEQWRGNLNGSVTLYDVDPRPDCMGARLEAGREYLVYASDLRSWAAKPGIFSFGWADVVPVDATMLQPHNVCLPGGLVSDLRVQKALRQIGKGSVPGK